MYDGEGRIPNPSLINHCPYQLLFKVVSDEVDPKDPYSQLYMVGSVGCMLCLRAPSKRSIELRPLCQTFE